MLNKSLLKKLKQSTKVARESRRYDTRRWDLGGKNACIVPGKSASFRALPRWDGKKDEWFYIERFIHWLTTHSGQRLPAWCLKNGNQKAKCPGCEEAAVLKRSKDEDERKMGEESDAQMAYIFNAVKGKPGARQLTDDDKPDIRYLVLNAGQFIKISDIMSGGEDDEEALGDISDIKEGVDIIFKRPAKQGDRWEIKATTRGPSLLYTKDEAEAFKGWEKLLLDLEAMIKKETKTYNDLYKLIHGQKADARDEEDDETEEEEDDEEEGDDDADETEEEEEEEEEESDDDEEEEEESDEDEEEEEEEEEEESDEDDDGVEEDVEEDDEDEEEEEADEDEEDEPVAKKKTKKTEPAKTKKSVKEPVKKKKAKAEPEPEPKKTVKKKGFRSRR